MEGIKIWHLFFCVPLIVFLLNVDHVFILSPDACNSTRGLVIPVYRHVKYCRKPIAYYNNTSACFQSAILLSGDVQLNPGPCYEVDTFQYATE